MLIEFDQTTIANMTAALDQVCKKIPLERDNYETRKKIADAMIESARSGRRTLNDFQLAGTQTLDQLIRPSKFGWFGLRQLLSAK
jgi:enhancing lycopene biosynthesis protein 2